MPQPPDFSYLDTVIEEIWQGKRVVLLPPGAGAFIAANLGFTIGGALCCAAALPEWLRAASDAARVSTQLVGIAVLVPQVVAPAVMVARGRPLGRRVLMRLIELWLLFAGVSAWLFVEPPSVRIACSISAAVLASTRYCLATRSYLVFTVFQERMWRRRRSELAQRKLHKKRGA